MMSMAGFAGVAFVALHLFALGCRFDGNIDKVCLCLICCVQAKVFLEGLHLTLPPFLHTYTYELSQAI